MTTDFSNIFYDDFYGIRWTTPGVHKTVTWSAVTDFLAVSSSNSWLVPVARDPAPYMHIFQKAFDLWDAALDTITFVQTDQGNAADVAIGIVNIDGPGGFYAYWNGQWSNGLFRETSIRFDADNIFTTDLLTTALHEIGNILGLGDINPTHALRSVQEDPFPEVFSGDMLWPDDITIIRDYYEEGELVVDEPNSAPIASIGNQHLRIAEWARLNTALSITDADGDAITRYEVWDSEGGDNNWWADGDYVDAASGYETSNLAGIWLQGAGSTGSQTLWVRAYDGEEWSEWDSFELTTYNARPTATVEDITILPGALQRLSDVLNYSDEDGDPLAEVEIWDQTGSNDWWLAGTGYIDASAGAVLTDPTQIWVRGDTLQDTQTLWLRASDGKDWSAWDSFELANINTPPTVSITDMTIRPGDFLRLSDILHYSDDDGDALAEVQIWDQSGSNDWWVAGSGYVDASAGSVHADPTQIWVRGDTLQDSQNLWVRASDGRDWSEWDSFELVIINAAPTVSIADMTIPASDFLRLSDILNYQDDDGDALTAVEVWDQAGSNDWWLAGSGFVDASAGAVLADPEDIWVRGDTVLDTQNLWVRARDGAHWSEWDSFLLTIA